MPSLRNSLRTDTVRTSEVGELAWGGPASFSWAFPRCREGTCEGTCGACAAGLGIGLSAGTASSAWAGRHERSWWARVSRSRPRSIRPVPVTRCWSSRGLSPERPDPHQRDHPARVRRLPRRHGPRAAEILPEDAVQYRVRPDRGVHPGEEGRPQDRRGDQAVRDDTVTGLLVAGFPGNGVFGYGTDGLKVTRVVADQRRRLRHLPFRVLEDRCSPTTPRSATTRPGSTSGTRRRPTPWSATTRRTATSSGSSSGTPGTSWSPATGSAETARASWSWMTDSAAARVTPPSCDNTVFRNNKFCPKNEDTPVSTPRRRHPAARRDPHPGGAQQRDR